jgi:NADPH:quinone reductase-like Zn-dependent oxidoreductase
MSTSQQFFSKITSAGQLEFSLVDIDMPAPESHEVVVKVEAAPINPSDMWPMFGPADLREASLSDDGTMLTAPVHPDILPRIKSRLDMTLPVGNEGAGTVVAAGDSPAAQALLGKTVGVLCGASYAQYCKVPVQMCLAHHEGTTAAQAASSFVNPLTALGMVDTMLMEGHTALVHTAAASSLGQMLVKICVADGVPLVNIVRKEEQVEILKSIGATHVVNSSSDTYKRDLTAAIGKSGATLAFDAIGGGELASDILAAMEYNASKDAVGFHTYGSPMLKQVYIYGALDVSPTVLNRAYGMSWAVGGFLLMQFLGKVTPERVGELHKRVADEIQTTFATKFTDVLSLSEAMSPATILKYNAKKTGEKFLINPNK